MKKDLSFTDKWIVLDLDGTVIYDDRVPRDVARSAELLKSSGWSLIVATGRILAGALRHIRSLGALWPAIVYDGARVMDPKSGAVYFERRMPADVAREVLRLGFDFPLEVQVYGDEAVRCRPSDLLSIAYFKSLDVKLEPVLLSSDIKDDVFRILYFGKPALVAKLKGMLEGSLSGKVNITLAGDDFLDVLPLGTSKGSALAELKKLSGLNDVYVVGVGDHMNDLEMLGICDFKVAPEDAVSDILEMADLVIPPASRKGFCALADFLLSRDFKITVNGRC
ncbi:MAG TPA: HAD family hydrolase [Acetomicrobium flavidum]|uniref:HAD-superfamily hydrolase, subfamily IIB n=1 Tax=Acetomicrobium mobile (strain ATCC BAA-54 / DSM 13181 / JCM 12221 / NGA) TaxID=891968 RepID=I4BVC5_ACEMN|nr:HAD family hydrolase [Acetomicrobium mobile]AFM21232.1 HAD-superfamily hydrolase, subfamily IIB [Acetomicrobium mobile DSM 13181]HOP87195.1 HAD family hydrolase [Acetomicrobium flavidum]HPP13994.1 HAD family hydrolase [Acetomicrobium flavidum]HPU68368.1 HAD family hydrolase [Acetomicrobium flavidum]